MENSEKYVCPHCGEQLKRWQAPQPTTWETDIQFICFNDSCSYYVRGWKWMREQYNVNSSYRYRLDPVTKESGPMPVWSEDALKDDIIPENE